MSLLRKAIKEMAAGGVTAAHAIGGHGGHQTTADLTGKSQTGLYSGGVVDSKKAKKKQKKNYKKMNSYSRGTNEKMTFMNMLRRHIPMNEDKETEFDPASVISKLDSAEKQAEVGDDTVPFGMKDDEGNIVQVYVRAEQADEFEEALASMMSGGDDDIGGPSSGTMSDEGNQNETSSREIAEILYKLRGRFEIVDVVWPTITGDEQQEQEIEAGGEEGGQQGAGGGEDIDLDAEGGDDEGDDKEDEDEDKEDDEEDGDEEMEADEGGAESQLQAVIDLLRQQAEAEKAKAEAQEAEAEREEAKYAAQAAAAKVKQEEDILDMEAYYDKKDKADKEAKQLAKLAKWKHEKAQDAQKGLASSSNDQATEQQERAGEFYKTRPEDEDDDVLGKDEFANMIVQRLRSNQ